jgi:hypothetical protein
LMKKRIPKRPRNLKPRNADDAVIDQLRRFDVDLSKPRDTLFYLYFPAEADARLAQEELVGRGFSVEVDRAAMGTQWLCLATKKVAPQLAEISSLTSSLIELAKEYRGMFDGWETAIQSGDQV